MQNKGRETPSPGIKLDDIYYALFRRKWIIVGFFSLGVLAAGFLYVTSRPVYRSNAALLIRYISETASLEEVSDGTQVKSPDRGGYNIMNSELQILTSFDLAQEVVTNVGVAKIIGTTEEKGAEVLAALLISKSLRIEVPTRSSVIKISFAHSDPEVARNVLGALINSYIRRHLKIHREVGIHTDFLTKQRDRFKAEIATAEAQIESLQLQAGGVPVEESKSAFTAEITRLRQQLFDVEMQLEQQSRLQPGEGKGAVESTNGLPVRPQLEEALVQRYRNVVALLASLRNKELGDQLRLNETNPILVDVRRQIRDAETLKRELEKRNASLATLEIPAAAGQPGGAGSLRPVQSVASLIMRTNVLNARLEKLENEVAALDTLESQINEWRRKKALAETNLWSYANALEQAAIADTLGPGKVSNISRVQEPSPAFRDPLGLIKKLAAALAFGLFGGIGVALVLELLFNRTFRRATDLVNRLGLPLFLSIPQFARNGMRKVRRAQKRRVSARRTSEAGETSPAEPPGQLALQTQTSVSVVGQIMQPYCEALRDRLMMYFQSRNMTHKPKLVAITSCAPGAGVSTLAAGLAASLSETGDGNVLLVDMNLPLAAGGHPLVKHQSSHGLVDAIEGGSKGMAQVQEHLFRVSANNGNGRDIPLLPQRFNSLVPKLKASDFDYIIFDMPPVSQTSPTVGLAPFFDIVLTVVESDKTKCDLAAEAIGLLQNPKSNLATILNRKRNYLPRWLHEEL